MKAENTTNVPAEGKDWMVLHAIADPLVFLAMRKRAGDRARTGDVQLGKLALN